MLALEVEPLGPLKDWEPVGAPIQSLLGALQGHDGITQQEINRLRIWAKTWPLLSSDLQTFYVEHAPINQSASIALWHLLDRRPDRINGPTKGALQNLWLEDHGVAPWISLTPRITL